MSAYRRQLKHLLTYWARGATSADGSGGFAAPVLIDGFYENTQEMFIDGQGREVRSAAVVFADQDLDIGGFILYGESGESSPREVDGAREIRGFSDHKSPSGRHRERKAWL
jgi:hypothetical protein